jgi:hypothetical protein
VIPIADAAPNVQEIGRKRAKILVKYDDALGRRAKVMIGKSQDRLHRHSISHPAPMGQRSHGVVNICRA